MFGHEFLEFEFHSNGKLRYSNNSHYKNEKMIRKECYVSDAVLTARLRAAASSNPQPELNIRADKTTPYRVIWKVMQDAKGAGMVHLGFITQGKARNGSGS